MEQVINADIYGRLVQQAVFQRNQPVSGEPLGKGIYILEVAEKGKRIYSRKVIVN